MLTNYDYVVDRESKFGTIHFDYIDDSRLVNYKRTALLVFRIESWFDNNGYGFRRGFMIPENSKHAVEHYKSLLMDDITLSFNEALFLLLGLDVLSLALSQFVNMDLINYKKSLDSSNMVENIFVTTAEFNELIRSDLTNNRIKSDKLVKLGKKYGFFNKLNNEKNSANTLKETKSSNNYAYKSETIKNQELTINKAKELLKDNPGLNKEHIAADISTWLEKHHNIPLSPANIEREYLPNFKKLKMKIKNGNN